MLRVSGIIRIAKGVWINSLELLHNEGGIKPQNYAGFRSGNLCSSFSTFGPGFGMIHRVTSCTADGLLCCLSALELQRIKRIPPCDFDTINENTK